MVRGVRCSGFPGLWPFGSMVPGPPIWGSIVGSPPWAPGTTHAYGNKEFVAICDYGYNIL